MSKLLNPDQQIKQELFSKLTNDQLLLYVLNENNKLITKKKVEAVLNYYDVQYSISNLGIFQTAMVHESYLKRDFKNDKTIRLLMTKDKPNDQDNNYERGREVTLNKDIEQIPSSKIKKTMPLQTDSYERLEFLGDSVVRLILTDYLYGRYEDQYEGFLTRLRTKLENGETLAKITSKLGLNEYAIIGRYYETQNARIDNYHILEDLMESFMGALYKDGGYDVCKVFFVNLIEKELDIAQFLHIETNYKDTLLQYHHKLKWSDPEYGLLEQAGTEKRIFKMFVKDGNNKIAGVGFGSSKKKGEQEAAKKALISYGVVKEEESDDESEYDEPYIEEPKNNPTMSLGAGAKTEQIDYQKVTVSANKFNTLSANKVTSSTEETEEYEYISTESE